jgi:hypothetical protein
LVNADPHAWHGEEPGVRTLCGTDHPAAVPPAMFFRIEQKDGYMYVCRHCARNLHRVVSSVTKFGVAIKIR